MTDALHRLDTVPNCTVVGDTSGVRTLIEASDQAYRQIQAKLEDCCYVEPVILHTRQ
ncbi:MAG TPA: hypothetical protein VFE62_09930 [Gemmataceae bacterium]|nr:hypothetical protein [Gemmataceae bacterium]